MRAIQTHYRGCHFRSRLEARWAVFFSALGLEWDYEPEGFELASGRYLPDFHIKFRERCGNTSDYWFEVKGDIKATTPHEWRRMVEFGQHKDLIILDGTPDVRMYLRPDEFVGEDGENLTPIPAWAHDSMRSGYLLMSPKGRPWFDEYSVLSNDPVYWRGPLAEIAGAVRAAKSARFEFGAQGR